MVSKTMRRTTFFIAMLVCCLMIPKGIQAQDIITVNITAGVKDKELRSTMEYNAASLLSGFNTAVHKKAKKFVLADGIATPEAKKKIEIIWGTSKLQCTANEIRTVCRIAASGEMQIRKIPVSMLKADVDSREEMLSLNFDKTGLISDILISNEDLAGQILTVNKKAITEDEDEALPSKDIVAASDDNAGGIEDEQYTQSEDYAELNKVVDFIEKFRTAYNCKDIYFLENIYSDNAVIINVVRKTINQVPNTDLIVRNIKLDDLGYDFQVKTKSQYMESLRGVFKKNSFVNVTFDSVKVERHAGYKKVYGVSLFQKWRSATYNDDGYLFLLIDCRKKDEMQIFVRAWAPEQIFNLNTFRDFKFYSN